MVFQLEPVFFQSDNFRELKNSAVDSKGTFPPHSFSGDEGAALSQKLNRGIILYRRLPARSGMGQLKPDAGG